MSRWSSEKIFEWYSEQEWLIGSNFLPSTAINQVDYVDTLSQSYRIPGGPIHEMSQKIIRNVSKRNVR